MTGKENRGPKGSIRSAKTSKAATVASGFLVFLLGATVVLAFDSGFAQAQATKPSSRPATESSNEDARNQASLLIQRTIDKMAARDLDGLMRCFWRSPDLIFVENEQITIGWDAVRNLLNRRYSNRSRLGTMVAEKVVVRNVAPDLVAGVIWWTIQYAASYESGTSTLVCSKISDSWYIISSSMTRP
jgi:hypothetical protein